jgi:hypothetical protein
MNLLPSYPTPSHEPTEAEIQRLAFQLWIGGGCRKGVELDNWHAAKALLKRCLGRGHGAAIRGPHQPPAKPSRFLSKT